MTANRSFLLHGAGSVCNFGCEAIVRGTVKLLREQWPQADIRYASLDWQADIRRLAHCPVEVVPRLPWMLRWQRSPRFSVWSILSKAREREGFSWLPSVERLDYLRDVDAVLSIGGDIYTPGSSGTGYPRSLIEFGEAVMGQGRRLVLWGASVGPFARGSQDEARMRRFLLATDLITSRESESTSYLRAIGVVNNVVACADPAFALSMLAERGNTEFENCIGINLSPLSFYYANASRNYVSAIPSLAHTVAAIIQESNTDVVLLPHVVNSYSEADDDLRFLVSVRTALPAKIRSRVHLPGSFGGFMDVKAIARRCRLVVAARMHAAINAISEGVPTVLLAYSSKAHGITKYIYGNTDWVFPVSGFALPSFAGKLAERLQEAPAERLRLAERMEVVQRDARRSVSALDSLLAAAQSD